MKTIFIILMILFGVFACNNNCTESKEKATYTIELLLVNEVIVTETFELLRGSDVCIGYYKGGYGLRLTMETMFNIYDRLYVPDSEGFIRWGAVGYKILSTTPVADKEHNYKKHYQW